MLGNLGHGLPRCVDDPEKLQQHLYLSSSTRPTRRSVAKSAFVRERTRKLALEGKSPSEDDRRRFTAFYADPRNRRELWGLHAKQTPPVNPTPRGGSSTRRAGGRVLPPSLERYVLKRYFDTQSTGDAKRDVLDTAAEGLKQRLDAFEEWHALSEADQHQITLEIFCLATLRDDRRILEDACSQVPELRDQYADLLLVADSASTDEVPAPKRPRRGRATPEPHSTGRVGDSEQERQTTENAEGAWRRTLQSLGALATEAADQPAHPATIGELRRHVATLEGLGARVQELREATEATEALKSLAEEFLALVGKDRSCEAIDATEIEGLRRAWLSVPTLDPDEVEGEKDRLEATVSPLLEKVRHAETLRRETVAELDGLCASGPSEEQTTRAWEDAQDELRDQEKRRRAQRRTAEDELLEALAPALPFPEPASDPEPPTQPNSPDPGPSEEQTDSVPGAEPRQAEPDEGPEPPTPEPGAPEESDDTDPESEVKAVVSEPASSSDQEASLQDEPGDSPKRNEQEQRIRDAVADALADDPPRLAYACQVCRLAEEVGIDAGQPRADLVEAALYASRLQRPDGALAAQLTAALVRFQTTLPDGIGRDAEGTNANALVGLAGALPAAVIAPYSGAAAYLQDLKHEGLDAHYRFASELAQRCWDIQNAQVDSATVLQAARGHAGQHDLLTTFQQDLRNWWAVGRKRKMSYRPANRVWNVLCQDSNELGRLMKAMESGGRADAVQRLSAQLGDEDELRKIVDRHSANLLSTRQNIDAKSLLQFQRHLVEALVLAKRYVALEEQPHISDHRQKVIDSLVQTVRSGLPVLLERLDAMAADRARDALLPSAASLAARVARRIEGLLGSSTDSEQTTGEPDPDRLLRSGLLPYPESGIDGSTAGDGNPQSILDSLLNSDPVELPVAFESHCALGNLYPAGDIVDWLEADRDENAIESLRSRLFETRLTLQRSLKAEVVEVRQAVDLAFSQGRISADENSDLLAQVGSVENAARGDRPRFNLLQGDLATVRRGLEAADKAERERVLEEAATSFQDEDDPRRRAIEQHVADGDLLVANELLHGSPEITPSTVHVERSSALEAYLEIDRAQLRSCTAEWRKLSRAAKAGECHGPLRFDRLDEGERLSAANLLRAWKDLKRAAPDRDADSTRKATADLLRTLGFIDPEVSLDPLARGFIGARFKAEPLRRREDCPLPHFGSEARGRYRLLLFLDPPTAEGIHQRMEQSGRQEATIAISLHALGDSTREGLVRTCLEKKKPLLSLDEPLIAFLAAQGGSRLAAFFACSLPFTYNQPFIRRASFVPPEMFFGRDSEAARIADLRGSCFVYGGRQLGKTALLRHVERTYSNPRAGQHAVWIDLKAEGIGEIDTADIWPAIWSALRGKGAIEPTVPEPTQSNESVRRFMQALHTTFNRDSGNTLLLLFDEADSFLDRDAVNSTRESFAESSRLKSLMDRDQAIKVVFAGLHNVLRTTTQSNHPLAHLGNPIRIGPFIGRGRQRHALDLLQRPLEACGCRFEPERLAHRVLAGTNYYPSLIQIYGAELAGRALEPADPSVPRTMTTALLDSIDGDPDLREEIRQRFEWTLQLDPRYEAIAYALASECHHDSDLLRHGMSDSRIQRHAHTWYEAGFRESGGNVGFNALLQEMVDLGVLRQVEARNYTLRNPNVLNLLGTSEDIDAKLGDLEHRKAPIPLGPHDKRRRHGNKGPLHRPLTLWQERQVIGNTRRHGVAVLCGLEAAGIGYARSFLAHGPVEVKELSRSSSLAEFEERLRSGLRQRQRRSGETVVFTVSGNWDEAWIDLAMRLLSGLRSRPYARVVFAAGTDRLMSLAGLAKELRPDGPPISSKYRTVDVVRLGPWSPGFAARWLDEEDEIGHKLTGNVEQDLTHEAGGWPALLELIRNRIREDGQASQLEADGMSTLLARNAEYLRRAFGLDRSILRKALRWVEIDVGAEAARREARVLRPDEQGRLFGGADQISLSEGPTQGPSADMERAIWAAEMLCLVERDSDDRLRVDPVVRKILDLTGD